MISKKLANLASFRLKNCQTGKSHFEAFVQQLTYTQIKRFLEVEINATADAATAEIRKQN
jgi:hypothetical protein